MAEIGLWHITNGWPAKIMGSNYKMTSLLTNLGLRMGKVTR